MSFVEFSHERWLIPLLINFHYWIWSELEVFLYAHYWIKWGGFYFNFRVVIAKAERKTTRKISNLFYRPCKFLDSRLMNRTLFSASSLPVSLANVVSFVMLCYVKRYDPVSFLIKKKNDLWSNINADIRATLSPFGWIYVNHNSVSFFRHVELPIFKVYHESSVKCCWWTMSRSHCYGGYDFSYLKTDVDVCVSG